MKKRIVLGGGCFWCIEAIFSNVIGVISAKSAYSGGKRPNPTYENVCSGATNHAEVVDIEYDDEVISLKTLLEIFFEIHDPTTLNQQGADIGTQYRSVIYYENDNEKEIIEDAIKEAQKKFTNKIVTEVAKLKEVYLAEDYHQNYYKNNPYQGYCQVVISPKIEKFKKRFPKLQKNKSFDS